MTAETAQVEKVQAGDAGEAQLPDHFRELERLRTAADLKGTARLLATRFTPREWRSLHLTPDEAAALREYKRAERRAKKEAPWQRDAYEHLCALREDGNVFGVARFAAEGGRAFQSVIFGDGLAPGVPQFVLTDEEDAALGEWEDALDPPFEESEQGGDLYPPNTGSDEWVRISSGIFGHYESRDGWWTIRRSGDGWAVRLVGEQCGDWEGLGRLWRPRYVPFETLAEAKDYVSTYGT